MSRPIIRSALYVPGANARALEKSADLQTDAIIVDLEDAVTPSRKAAARQLTADALDCLASRPGPLAVRVNGLDSSFIGDDMVWLSQLDPALRPNAIIMPKIGSDAGLAAANTFLDTIDPQGTMELWAMLETPRAVINAPGIAEAGLANPRFTTVIVGSNDLAKDGGIALGGDRANLLPWLLTFVAAAKTGGLTILDGVCNNFREIAAFEAECQQGRAIGMDGKTLIHPAQIEACNRVFSPTAEEISQAQAIVDAFTENDTKAVLELNGSMIERLHLEMAEEVLARAEMAEE